MSNFLYQSFFIGDKVQKLIVFLHGYNSCIDDLLPSIGILKKELNNTLIVIAALVIIGLIIFGLDMLFISLSTKVLG